MKYFTSVNIFKFSWDQVASGYWNRYPNPQSTHVLSEDVVDRHVSKGCLHTKRLISKTNKLPKWGEMFVPGPRHGLVVEESEVNPRKKTFTTYTRNITLTKAMVIEEKCVYRQSPDNKKWTECHREAWVSSTLFGFARALQAFGIDRYKKNVVKNVKGFEYVLNKIYIPESIPDQTPLLGNFSKGKLKERAQEKAKTLAKKVIITN